MSEITVYSFIRFKTVAWQAVISEGKQVLYVALLRGLLVRCCRLETYKPLNWFGKPEVASATACASRGWINEARDTLCCEFCSVKLIYPSTVPVDHRQRAAELFSEQLVSKHASHCPWRSTKCDESVLAFTAGEGGSSSLVSQYQSRVESLSSVEMLPELYPKTVQQLSSLGGENFAQTVASSLTMQSTTPSCTTTLPPKLHLGQRARFLALLGWEADLLTAENSVTPMPCNVHSMQNPPSTAYSLGHLVGVRKPAQTVQQVAKKSMGSTVLHCSMCR